MFDFAFIYVWNNYIYFIINSFPLKYLLSSYYVSGRTGQSPLHEYLTLFSQKRTYSPPVLPSLAAPPKTAECDGAQL